MPVTVSYPGVYIEEIPSGVRTITGVATSIAAFIGRTSRGPTDEAVTVFGLGDFERIFGELHSDYPMGYAVRDFFMNGGGQAVIVRLFQASATGDVAELTLGAIKLKAKSPGEWGARLRASIDTDVPEEVATKMGLAKADLFNLTVRHDVPGGASEKFLNLTVKKSSRRADQVLRNESSLVEWVGDLDKDPLPAIAKASDPVMAKEEELNAAKKALQEKVVKGEPAQAEKDAVTAAEKALAEARKTAEDAVTDGESLKLKNFTPPQGEIDKKGLYALERADLFNLLCIPPETREGSTDPTIYQAALAYCQKRRAMLIVDPPEVWDKPSDITKDNNKALTDLGLSGNAARNAALYFPRVLQADPNQEGRLAEFVPCGAVAGVMARTDVTRGVWKAPAGLDASLNGVQGLAVNLTDQENGTLNPLGVNCLRSFPVTGRVVWGARTLRGADVLADEYRYIPVRRLALFIEESLYRGTQWVVFEPNDEPLWAQIRTNVGAFMNNLFRQGAFQGSSPREAYLVKCDKETTTQNDINLGIVNIVVGFAPLKPAEFVIVKIQQLAGQIET